MLKVLAWLSKNLKYYWVVLLVVFYKWVAVVSYRKGGAVTDAEWRDKQDAAQDKVNQALDSHDGDSRTTSQRLRDGSF